MALVGGGGGHPIISRGFATNDGDSLLQLKPTPMIQIELNHHGQVIVIY